MCSGTVYCFEATILAQYSLKHTNSSGTVLCCMVLRRLQKEMISGAGYVSDRLGEWRFTAPVPVDENGLQYEVEFEVQYVSYVYWAVCFVPACCCHHVLS